MSIITKIRNRSGLAIAFVGGALLLFVVSDALNSNYGLFGGGQSTDVGEIAGESIGIKQFEEKMNLIEEQFKARGQNIDDNTRNSIREQAWNQLIQEKLVNKEFADLGINVGTDELADMFYGDNIHQAVKQNFTDPKTGSFDKNQVLQSLKQISAGNDEKIKAQLKEFEDYLVTDGMSRKYAQLVKKGVFTTTLEAKNLYNARTRTAELSYVAMPYTSVSDSAVKIDESELKSYFNKNQAKYIEKENTRKLEFVVWDFAPSGEDSANIQRRVNELTEQFRSAENDTMFVDQNSEVKFDINAKPREEFAEDIAGQLFSDSLGSVIGPIFKDGKYMTYKISGTKQDTAYHMRASHILFKVEGTGTAEDTANSMIKAAEVLEKIKKGQADFNAMAMEHGTDGTKDKGGDLGWFAEWRMVKEFSEFCKSHKKGDIGLVKTQFGWHIVKMTEEKTKKLVCAGVLETSLKPSQKTTSSAFNDANQFAAVSRSAEEFDKNITAKKLEKKIAETVRENDNYLPGYPEAREVVRWAFNSNVGDVSEVFTVGDKYVIAVLKAVRQKGKANFEAARQRVEPDFIKEKKAEQLMQKMQAALDGGANTLDALSKKLNLVLTPVGAQSFDNANIAYVGQDNSFVGAVFGSAPGKLVAPFKGDAGIFAFTLNKFNAAPEIKDFTQYVQEINGNLTSRLEFGYQEALKEIHGVVDNRFRFY